MITTTVHHAKIPLPLATDAGVATRSVGPCALCSRMILRGMRYALLAESELAAHVPCIARLAGTPARKAP